MGAMRNRFIAVAVAIALVAIATLYFVVKKENVDIVKGVPPVSTSLQGVSGTLEAMARLPENQRAAYLERSWPHLQRDLVYYLRRIGRIQSVQKVARVQFKYGSLEKVAAESGRGAQRYGYFNDQLVALVWITGSDKPISVLVQCLNGTFIPLDKLNTLQAVGDHTPIETFTIAKGQGLIHHVDFPVAIDLAEHFGLPLYKGRNIVETHRITPEVARRLESTVNRIQVTVHVHAGDRFDLRNMTYVPANQSGRT